MEIEKLKIIDVAKLKKGVNIPVAGSPGSGFSFVDGKVVTYQIEKTEIEPNEVPDTIQEIIKRRQEAKLDAEQEFQEKFQIRPGKHFYDEENGMVAMPQSEDKFFETKTSAYVKSLFQNFFDKSDHISQKFKRNKRAYLLYSDPGMGKSALIRNFCEFAATPGTAIIQVHGDVNFSKLTNIFFRSYREDVSRIVLIIEDFGKRDYISNCNILNASCLNFLDGFTGLFPSSNSDFVYN
jgi:hypothetical protein